MKFKVLFIKKRHIYYIVLAILILVLLFIVLSVFRRSAFPTSSMVSDSKIIKSDINGDGIEDILYISTDKNKYSVQANIKGTSIPFKPDQKYNTLGMYYPYWPMRITFLDISRDKIPEIFIQSSQRGTPVQHVFLYNNSKFKDIFCGSNNILGFVDCKSNRTPKFLSGMVNNNSINFSNYILLNKKFQNYTVNTKDNYIGKDTILSFIQYVKTLPQGEENKPQNIFYPNLTGKDIALIGKLAAENNSYSFQDGLFMDTKCNKDGEISEMKWTLNFKGISNINASNIKNYTLNVILRPYGNADENYYFKVFSMSLVNNK